nr:caspase family protein [Streptomyces argyrophyllae]
MSASGGGPDWRDRRFRALLVGVDQYRDHSFRSMPFITTELRVLAEALETAGYQEAEVLEAGELHAQAIEDEIERFVRKAAPGDHLLLVLSGHGFHSDGVDYLVTGPARLDSLRFKSRCLPVEFGAFLRESDAAQLVVAVDACRDPFETFTKSVGDGSAWSKGATGYEDYDDPGRPRYAHVYACARYATAGFGYAVDASAEGHAPETDEATGFSYFTRALTEIARDTDAPGSLDALEPLLDERVRDIARSDRRRSDQCVQINFATGRDGLLLFPHHGGEEGRPAEDHPWQHLAAEHEAWRRVRPGNLTETERDTAVAQVRDAVVRLVGLWGRATDDADAWLAAYGDIWRPADSESRMGTCVETMLRGAVGPAPDLSLTEAALLVLAPFLYTAFGTRLAHLSRDIRPWTLADGVPAGDSCGFATRGAFERYCGAHQALRDRERRARERGRDDEARAVAWWLARQWLLRLPGSRDAVVRSGLAGLETPPDGDEFGPVLVRQVLTPARLRRLTDLIGLDLEQAPPPEPDTVAAQHAAEHMVNWDKVSTLLTVAHHMAVDPVLLPSLVAEHLGISDPVDGTAFREALRRLTWQPDGPRRVLSAECPHQAVELALRQHTDALDRTIRAVQGRADSRWATALGVPAGFGASKVTPAAGDDGRVRYEAADIRFRLDGDRVRDLLMGEQLYHDRALALRELYQNALDACRYRKARTELWNRRNPSEHDDWQGRIVFTQGVEDGRPYIECHDNGIGMGRHELRRLFAFAGSRFVEEREFLAEWAEWEREGIPFHPNSRFGVGVLSYFMLADEIRVTTSRLGNDMRTGERLVVHIDGPGALFRIRSDRAMLRSGTKVRLYLRRPDDDISCGEVLRRQLWVSDFSVRVEEDGKEPLRWEPGKLSAYVGPDSSDEPAWAWRSGDGEPIAAEDAGDGVWWCSGRGAVLADGLWAGEGRFGVVVNLTAEHAPRLSVNRGAMLDDHEEHVRALLTSKIPYLFAEGGRVLSLEWLHALVLGGWPTGNRRLPVGTKPAGQQGWLADRIAEQAVTRGHQFSFRTVNGEVITADTTAVGCCPADQWWVGRLRATGTVAVITQGTGLLAEWRARVWAAAEPGAGVLARSPLPATRPTDESLLQQTFDRRQPLSLGALLSTVKDSGLEFAYVVDRMRQLGVKLPDEAVLRRVSDIVAGRGEISQRQLMRLISEDRDGVPPWIPPGGEVDAEHLSTDGLEPRTTAGLLAALGFRVPGDGDGSPLRRRVWPPAPQDLATIVVRANLDPNGATLPRDQMVPKAHLVLAVGAFPGQAARIADALVAAGYRLPSGHLRSEADPVVLELLSEYGGGRPPWRPLDRAVPLYHLFGVSQRRYLSVEDLVAALDELDVPSPPLPPADEQHVLARLVREIETYYGTFLRDMEVTPSMIVRLAEDNRLPDREVARYLARLGYVVQALSDHPRRPDTYRDLMLLSSAYDGKEPWLDTEREVPWCHVVRAAHDQRTTTEEIVARLTGYGYRTASEPPAGTWTRDDELTLLRGASQHEPVVWLPPDRPVTLTHVLHAAQVLARTPAEVAGRLRQLGHHLPADVEFTDPATP